MLLFNQVSCLSNLGGYNFVDLMEKTKKTNDKGAKNPGIFLEFLIIQTNFRTFQNVFTRRYEINSHVSRKSIYMNFVQRKFRFISLCIRCTTLRRYSSF